MLDCRDAGFVAALPRACGVRVAAKAPLSMPPALGCSYWDRPGSGGMNHRCTALTRAVHAQATRPWPFFVGDDGWAEPMVPLSSPPPPAAPSPATLLATNSSGNSSVPDTPLSRDCVLQNVHIRCASPLVFDVRNGSLVLIDSSVTVDVASCARGRCYAEFRVNNTVDLRNSSVRADPVWMVAQGPLVRVDNRSALSSDGVHDSSEVLTVDATETLSGGSWGGAGTFRCNGEKAQPEIPGPQQQTRCGFCPGGDGHPLDSKAYVPNGGGRVYVSVPDGRLHLAGRISVDGGHGTNFNAAGAGGSIFVEAQTITSEGVAMLSAAGGSSEYPGAGGGGKIWLNISDLGASQRISRNNIDVRGGLASACGAFGGTGFVYFPNLNSVAVLGPPEGAHGYTVDSFELYLSSRIFLQHGKLFIQRNTGFELRVPDLMNMTNSSLVIQTSDLKPSDNEPECVLRAGMAVMRSGSSVRAMHCNLVVDVGVLEMDKDSSVQIASESTANNAPRTAWISANYSLELSNVRPSDAQSIEHSGTETVLTISAPYVHHTYGLITASKVRIRANRTDIRGSIQATLTQDNAEQCSQPIQVMQPRSMPNEQSRIALWIHTADRLKIHNIISASIIVVTAGMLHVEGEPDDDDGGQLGVGIVADSQGCLPGKGLGAGNSGNAAVPGSGAGHSGVGGDGIVSDDVRSNGGGKYDVLVGCHRESNTSMNCMPRYMGSGGGGKSQAGDECQCGGGGRGGGYIYLEVDFMLRIGVQSRISARGGDGTAYSGGGSGGSIVVRAQAEADIELDCKSLNVGGGDGADGQFGPGGGGGGVIMLEYPFDRKIARHCSDGNTQTKTRHVVVLGGAGNWPGRDGADGLELRYPPCPPGHEGLLCTECAMGKYNPVQDNLPCERCPAGNFSDALGATTCKACSVGKFTAQSGLEECTECAPGRGSRAQGASTCDACDAGEFSSAATGGVCVPCAIGFFNADQHSSSCKECPAGSHTTELGATACVSCPKRPHHSHWEHGGRCKYTCEQDYVGEKCLTPLREFIRKLGGSYVFMGLIGALAIVLFTPFVFLHRRAARERRAQAIADRREFGTDALDDSDDEEVMSIADSDAMSSTIGSRRTPLLPHELASPARSTATREFGSGRPFSSAALIDPEGLVTLRDEDLDMLLERVYLEGSNRFDSPLRIHSEPRGQVERVVLPNEFAEFSVRIAAAASWEPWETAVFYLLVVLYLPLASTFQERRRWLRLQALSSYLAKYDHAFLRNYRARALCNSVKFGTSPCGTLAWIDLLAHDREEIEQHSLDVGQPRLPVVLVCAGQGSYLTPFYIDVSDPLVKAVSKFYGPAWFNIITRLNEQLRTVDRANVLSIAGTIQCLQAMMLFGSNMQGESGDLRLDIGYRAPPDGASSSGWRPALIVSRVSDVPNAVSSEFSYSSDGLPRPRFRMQAVSSEQTRREEAAATEHLRVSLSQDAYGFVRPRGPSEYDVRRSSASATRTDGDMEQNRSQPSEEIDHYNEMNMQSDLPHNVLRLSRMLDLNAVRAASRRAGAMDQLRQFFVRFTLTNVPRRFSRQTVSVTMLVLLVLLLGSTFTLSAAFVLSLGVGTYMYMLMLFPLADVLAPLVGLAAVTTSSATLARRFSQFNTIAILNAVVGMLIGVRHRDKLGPIYGVVVPIGIMVIKLLLSFFNNLFVAHVSVERDVALTKRDYLKLRRMQRLKQLDEPITYVDATGATLAERTLGAKSESVVKRARQQRMTRVGPGGAGASISSSEPSLLDDEHDRERPDLTVDTSAAGLTSFESFAVFDQFAGRSP